VRSGTCDSLARLLAFSFGFTSGGVFTTNECTIGGDPNLWVLNMVREVKIKSLRMVARAILAPDRSAAEENKGEKATQSAEVRVAAARQSKTFLARTVDD
jgi:hypothetical protein